VFKNRWRTLLSVDDLIAEVIAECERLGVADQTYFVFSSDHGFQLGQFNIPMDKRHVYDWNSRIPLVVRGPGIAPGSHWQQPATQVDLFNTFLGLAGLSSLQSSDGKSLAPFLISNASQALQVTQQHLQELGERSDYMSMWRDAVFFEYYYVDDNVKCIDDPNATHGEYPQSGDKPCGVLGPNGNTNCWDSVLPSIHPFHHDCYPTESEANNFIALRSMPGSEFGDTLYVEYQTGSQTKLDVNFSAIGFVEFFNATDDQWMVRNLHNNSCGVQGMHVVGKMHDVLHKWFQCSGLVCP